MSKKIKVFCDIDKYLQTHYTDLYDLMDAVCVLGAIKSNKFRREKTFIIPSDAEIKKIIANGISEDISKVGEAVKAIKASSIEHYLPDGKAWTEIGVVRNGLGRELKVEKATDKKVTLNKCEIEKVDVAFLPIKTQDGKEIYNYAIYKVVSGAIPTDTPEFVRGESNKTGSRARYIGSSETDRIKLVSEFAKGGAREQTINLNSLFICAVRANIPHLYLLPCFYASGSKLVTYGIYVLLRGTDGQYLIPEEVLTAAQNPNNIATPKEIYKAIEDITRNNGNLKCFGDIEDHLKALNRVRRDLSDSDKEELVNEIKAEYQKILDNSYFPQECKAFLGDVNLLLYIHYLIFLGNFSANNYSASEMIQKLSKLYTCSDWKNEKCLDSTVFGQLSDDLYAREKLKMLLAFVSSDAFLYQHALNADQIDKLLKVSEIPIKFGSIVGAEENILMSGAYDE